MASMIIPGDLSELFTAPLTVGGDVIVTGLQNAPHLNGRRGCVVEALTAGRYGVRMDVGVKRVRQRNLISVGDPHPDGGGNVHPRAYDAVMRSPRLQSEATCDVLCDLLAKISGPEQFITQLPALAEFDSDITKGLTGQQWIPRADARLVWLKLDAVGHHLLLEWRKEQGWRVVQSSVTEGDRGYTALEWCAPSTIEVGSFDGGACHSRFGRGKVLSDAEMTVFWKQVLDLRSLCDDFVAEVLLPQLTVENVQPTRFPSTASRGVKTAWLESVGRVSRWAHVTKQRGMVEGLHTIQLPHADIITVGGGHPANGEELFVIPRDRKQKLDVAYSKITGEPASSFIYFQLLNMGTGYADGLGLPHPSGDLSKFGGYFGFAVQGICWNSD